mmetsp:Transcript_57597/g.134961  ORF Transcript_57597/g.134961 Transcript_57597/m.134961 type:complete len:241 (-) Transcript_57597:97-819(-)
MAPRYKAARIFIAACATQASVERQLAVPRRSRDRSSPHNLEGTIADVSTMLKLFEAWDKADGKTQVQYMHIYQIPGEYLPKKQVMATIEKAMDTAEDEVLLWYSGHGQSITGNWTFQEEGEERCNYVTFDEIAKLWGSRRRTATLHIFMDSCYAGAWAQEACRLGPAANIAVFAACQADETAGEVKAGGAFTLKIRDVVSSGHKSSSDLLEKIYLTPIEADQHPCAYFSAWDERRMVGAR